VITKNDPKRLAQIALVVLLIIGCISILLPFIGAVLFAFVIWACTWDFYSERILPRLGNRDTLGALLVTLGLVLILLLPTLFLAFSIADVADNLIGHIKPFIDKGRLPAKPPAWLASLPVFGSGIRDTWMRIATVPGEFDKFISPYFVPARQMLLSAGAILANGLVQISLVLFVAFFLFRDGKVLSASLYTAARKLGGEFGEHMLDRTRDTVIGVMLGIVGTAVGQGTAAMIGFLIAGVPAAVLLGFITFFLSMVPVGPPLVWGGAAAWLYWQGDTGATMFMVFYGLFVISSIDNFLKPILMARGAGLSILLVALGVFGGLLVLGFIGIFLGPVLLALGHMLFVRWIHEETTA
jgi:predicted PurR-regulated permease PerM